MNRTLGLVKYYNSERGAGILLPIEAASAIENLDLRVPYPQDLSFGKTPFKPDRYWVVSYETPTAPAQKGVPSMPKVRSGQFIGYVKWFEAHKGFGAIVNPYSVGEDGGLFFHQSKTAEGFSPQKGDWVTYQIDWIQRKRRPEAIGCQLLQDHVFVENPAIVSEIAQSLLFFLSHPKLLEEAKPLTSLPQSAVGQVIREMWTGGQKAKGSTAPEKVQQWIFRLKTAKHYVPALLSDLGIVEELSAPFRAEYLDSLVLSNSSQHQVAEKIRVGFEALVPDAFPADFLEEKFTPGYRFRRWAAAPQLDAMFQVSADILLAEFPTLPTGQQDAVFNLLDPATRLDLALALEDQPVAVSLKKRLWQERFKAGRFLILDLESDRQAIQEIAWANGENQLSTFISEPEAALNAFRQAMAGIDFFVGHNLLDFDVPILARHEVIIAPASVWDTLRVEALLNPTAPSLALQTAHRAADDVALTRQLFESQVSRLLQRWAYLPEGWQTLLHGPALAWLETLRAIRPECLLNETALSVQPESFFRHVERITLPLTLPILPTGQPGVLLAPAVLWPQLAVKSMHFVSIDSDGLFCRCLDAVKVKEAFAPDDFRGLALRVYLNDCTKTARPALLRRLSTALRVWVGQVISEEQLCLPATMPEEVQLVPGAWTVLTEREWPRLRERLPGVQVLPVNALLSALLNKQQLIELNFSELAQLPDAEALWVKFSGGQSYLTVTRAFASLVVSPEKIAGFTQFWLEKTTRGTFRLWANTRPEKVTAERASPLALEAGQFPTESLRLLVFDEKTLDSPGLLRLNPETLYRDQYWTYQRHLLRNLPTGKPLVLLVRNTDEVAGLSALFRADNYFVPSEEAALGRRIELLHQSMQPQRLLVLSEEHFEAVLSHNQAGSLTVCFDSLNLAELQQLTQVENSEKPVQDTGSENDEEEAEKPETFESPTSEPLPEREDLDVFGLLTKADPLLHLYRAMLLANNPDNELVLADARLDDFPLLARTWNARRTRIPAWGTADDFARDLAQVKRFIHSVQPEPAFNPELAQRAIEQIFIGGKPLSPQQKPYFDLIFPADRDVAVSLPTGGGKSVLFQGPALYRASQTNRLSVVISPLKALMADQVDGLENRGFWSSVAFINQDTDDVADVYRRLAGGELLLLYVTPERFRVRRFDAALHRRLATDGRLEYVIFDEAHCISQWGLDFRPDYQWVTRRVKALKTVSQTPFPALLFSATLSEQIFNDIEQLLA